MNSQDLMKSIIQRVATGPDLSKDIAFCCLSLWARIAAKIPSFSSILSRFMRKAIKKMAERTSSISLTRETKKKSLKHISYSFVFTTHHNIHNSCQLEDTIITMH
jgi:hypothetical protein